MEHLIERLSELTDVRRQWGNLRHKLVDIVFIGLVSVICGGTDFEHMEDTGYGKLEWFKERLELPNGVPDSDTFRRVFERLNPRELAEILQETVSVEGKTVAIDGKTICGSGSDKHRAYHVVSAWVAENQITLGQLAVAEKSNEITAIPELLDMLDVSGSTVTIDAMGCQKQIAAKAIQNHADYVLGLKGNQSSLLDDVKFYFDEETVVNTSQTREKDHGRIEQRAYYLETQIDWLSQKPQWAGSAWSKLPLRPCAQAKSAKNAGIISRHSRILTRSLTR